MFPALVLQVLRIPLPLQYPLDFKRTWRGKRILGDHKTIAGTFLMFLGAYSAWLVIYIFSFSKDIEFEAFSLENRFIISGIITSGVFVGDTIGSFIKRRIDVDVGKDLLIVDNLDWILGFIIALSFVYELPKLYIIFSFSIFFFLLHVSLDKIAHHFNLRN